jgi:hypothetical protein
MQVLMDGRNISYRLTKCLDSIFEEILLMKKNSPFVRSSFFIQFHLEGEGWPEVD